MCNIKLFFTKYPFLYNSLYNTEDNLLLTSCQKVQFYIIVDSFHGCSIDVMNFEDFINENNRLL